MRAQRQKLRPEQIDKNAYRHPPMRERAPRDMPKRRAPGWVACNFILPRMTMEGLTFLARSMANRERAERLDEPRGFRRLIRTRLLLVGYRILRPSKTSVLDGIEGKHVKIFGVCLYHIFGMHGLESQKHMRST
jgi:hypothetical protein